MSYIAQAESAIRLPKAVLMHTQLFFFLFPGV